jgi:hypothetical protein
MLWVMHCAVGTGAVLCCRQCTVLWVTHQRPVAQLGGHEHIEQGRRRRDEEHGQRQYVSVWT